MTEQNIKMQVQRGKRSKVLIVEETRRDDLRVLYVAMLEWDAFTAKVGMFVSF